MIFYKVNDPDRTLQVPSLIWDLDAGRAGLDEISAGNEWEVTNVGNAVALWNPSQGVTTVTINFNNSNIGKNVAVTVAAEGRDSVGVGVKPINDAEWQETVNVAIQETLFNFFIDNGEYTMNDNGLKGTAAAGFMEAVDAEESVFERDASDIYDSRVVDAAD